jgi:hypothetical protein
MGCSRCCSRKARAEPVAATAMKNSNAGVQGVLRGALAAWPRARHGKDAGLPGSAAPFKGPRNYPAEERYA